MISLAGQSNGQRNLFRVALSLLAILTLFAACGQSSTTGRVQTDASSTRGPKMVEHQSPGVEEPTEIEIPSIGVDAKIIPIGLKENGDMQTPDFGLAGWYTPGPRPGADGPAVVVAHVDSRSGPDVFYRLKELRPGDLIHIRQADGQTATFRADATEQTPKDELPVERIWNDSPDPVIRLVTCGGQFDRKTRHYLDNIIVYGSLAD